MTSMMAVLELHLIICDQLMGKKEGYYTDPTSMEVFVQVEDVERNYCDTTELRSGSAVSAKNRTLQHSMNHTKWYSIHARRYLVCKTRGVPGYKQNNDQSSWHW